jgi:hypothetical protein
MGIDGERVWTTFDAVMVAEGVEDADEETQLSAWQHLITTGVVWTLQGWFGRQARALIDAGHCVAP